MCTSTWLNKELTLTICRRLAITMTRVILKASSAFSYFANSQLFIMFFNKYS